jgi:catechol 2,3-dioxygenase-like lactoylglutathione lyase family enzyme
VTVYVTDHDKAKAFYSEALGFKVKDDQPYGPGFRWLTADGLEHRAVSGAPRSLHGRADLPRSYPEPLEAYVEGYVIDQWRNPEAIKIAQSDDDRLTRIRRSPPRCATCRSRRTRHSA